MKRTTMSMHRINRNLAAFAVAALCAHAALPHTTVRSQATESVIEDNALKIGHGCTTPEGARIPVVAQSVVFPGASPEVSTSDGSPIASLDAVIEQGTIAGLVRAIQDKGVFRGQQVKRDALGNMTGWSGTGGALDVDALGRVPFQFAAPKFVATTCAKRLLVRVAIADVCLLGAGLADSIKPGKVNLWIPDNGNPFAVAGSAQGIDGIGAPATLTVNRNVATNPMPASCGSGIDVTVTPSAADVTTNLPIPGVWP
jgi:hypothetical protein